MLGKVKAIRAFQLIQGLIKPQMKWHAVMGNEAIELYKHCSLPIL